MSRYSLPTGVLNYEIAGDANPAILFVHGGACRSDDWTHQMAALSPLHTSIAVDLPGHGESTTTQPEHCTVGGMAEDLETMCDALALPVVVVGHSYGCRIALQMAHDRPDLVAGVVLIDGSRVWDGTADDVARDLPSDFDIKARFKRIIADCLIDRLPPEDQARIVRNMTSPAPDVLRAMSLASAQWDLHRTEPVLADLACPLLAIQSTYWNFQTPRHRLTVDEDTAFLHMLRRAKPDAQAVVLPDVGHFSMLEVPDVVSDLIGRFSGGCAR